MLASFSPTDAKDPETWIPVQHGAILWAAASGLERRRLHDGASTVAFSPRTSEIAITAGRRVTLRDAATGAQLREFTSPSKGVNTVAMSPDGQHLLTGDGDGLARMWRVATGELACEFKGHTDGLRSVALSPDGARLATAGDHTARLYGMRPPGRRRAARAGHTSDVFTVRFAPNARQTSHGRIGSVRSSQTGAHNGGRARCRCAHP
jgi:WD40 repeat protein